MYGKSVKSKDLFYNELITYARSIGVFPLGNMERCVKVAQAITLGYTLILSHWELFD